MEAAVRKYLLHELETLQEKMLRLDKTKALMISRLPASQQPSASNLLHYLQLRNHDIRPLQEALHHAGLSSIDSSESHILYQVEAIMNQLGKKFPSGKRSTLDQTTTRTILQERTVSLFGPEQNEVIPHIMVTFDIHFAEEPEKVRELLTAGMQVARINCAHDDPKIWAAMIENVRAARQETGLPCPIYMDLAGPKIRTLILGKGSRKERVKFKEPGLFLLAEKNAGIPPDQLVIGCSFPGIINQLRSGERVLFDDGKFEAIVRKVDPDMALLEMVRLPGGKCRLKAGKGINFPDSRLQLPSLSAEDRMALPFVVRHADLIGYSFVNTPEDLRELQVLLKDLCRQQSTPPVVLKIETGEAVQNLPALLLQAMRQPLYGVMIARGDLAVEIGFERLSEIQEQILWICEAAHAPVIWATQVLESLNKTGIASRSEVTDAAHGVLADCVMINKGEHVLAVIKTLKDILMRSGGHRSKKSYSMRPLEIAKKFLEKEAKIG